MQSLVVVGLQWGDEGKGKLVDYISEKYDVVARFQGGSNAGHTVIVDEETFKFRILPTGAVRGKKAVIGNGVVVDLKVLLDEIHSLETSGIHVDLLISDRAHIITPYHIQIDGLQEEEKADHQVGTTKRGIGPAYADKMERVGIRVCDLLSAEPSDQWDQLESSSSSKIEKLHRSAPYLSKDEIFRTQHNLLQHLKQYVGDSGQYLDEAIKSGQRVLFEGAQGALLDIDHGTYPFVTSSNCVSANAATGTGISFKHLDAVLGICKAYATRVGTGPFPTELVDDVGRRIQKQGREYGTVTGRPRRCGWLDLFALKYAIRINGAEHLAITKLDVLSDIQPLRVCIGYILDGTEIRRVPASSKEYEDVSPIYEELKGWSKFTASSYDELPGNLREYVSYIEQFTGSTAAILSIGPDRKDTLDVPRSRLKDA